MESAVNVSPSRETNRWLVLTLVCLAQFMVVLDATIVNIALPSIQKDLELSATDLQWIVNGYTLMFGGFLLLGGRAADLIGRKKLFLAGITVFTLASLLDGLARSSEMLILARGLQGLGGALVSPAALSVIMTTFSDGPDRAKALGVWGAIASGGSAFGLLLGGVLTEQLSWPWIFFVNVPIGLAALALSFRFVPESKANLGHRSFDFAGAVSVTAGLIALVYVIVKAPTWGWESSSTIGFGAVAVALLLTFVMIERKSRAPLVRLDIFKMRSLSVANVSMMLVASGLFAMFFFCSLYIQQVLGFSPIDAGLAFLPVTAAIMFGAGAASGLVKKFSAKTIGAIGLTIATVGMWILTQVSADGSYVSDLLPGLLPLGLGMGMTFVPLTLIATTNVGDHDAGLASGLFNTSQQVGGALGLAILSTIAANETKGTLASLGHVPLAAEQAVALVDGWQAAFLGGTIFMLAGLVFLVVRLRNSDVSSITDGAAGIVAPEGE